MVPGSARTGADGVPRIAWVAPENRNSLRKPGDLQEVDDAPQVLRDVLVRVAERRGCRTVPSRSVDSLVARAFPERDLTDGKAARIGAELGAEFVVYGRLEAWGRGTLFGRSTSVRFRLDVVDSAGNPLAHLTHEGTAAQEDPADLADSLASEVVDSLQRVWGGCVDNLSSP